MVNHRGYTFLKLCCNIVVFMVSLAWLGVGFVEWESGSHIQAIGSYVLRSAASLVLSFDPIVLLTKVYPFSWRSSRIQRITRLNK